MDRVRKSQLQPINKKSNLSLSFFASSPANSKLTLIVSQPPQQYNRHTSDIIVAFHVQKIFAVDLWFWFVEFDAAAR
jgi:hypothetical protein